MRNAFSMITAIFVIIVMATVAMLVMSTSGKIVKETSIQFRKEQAMFLARSYTELAVLAVTNYDRSTSSDCIEDIDGVVNALTPGAAPATGVSSTNGGGYDVQTRIYYLGNGLPCSQSRKLNDSTDASRSSTTISTDYNGTSPTGPADELAAIIVDVYVSYKDPDVPDPAHSPWITYHRRTLQKI
jgi:type II secretory pathway pseudopilin PulG